MEKKKPNNKKLWNDQEEIELTQIYEKVGNDGLDEIAAHFNRGRRNVISKLVHLKIYNKPEQEKVDRRTVKKMLMELETLLDIEIDGLNLTKKENLELVVDAIYDKLGVSKP